MSKDLIPSEETTAGAIAQSDGASDFLTADIVNDLNNGDRGAIARIMRLLADLIQQGHVEVTRFKCDEIPDSGIGGVRVEVRRS